MPTDDPELTQADFDAADEALSANPGDVRSIEHTRQALAELHAQIGSSRFRFFFGLRAPENRVEEILKQYFRQEINWDELREQLRSRALRSIDHEMLDQMYADMELRIAQYGLGLQAIAEAVNPSCSSAGRCELRATTHFEKANGKFSLLPNELETVRNFLDEVRLEFSLGLATVRNYSSSNAVILSLDVFALAVEHWKSCLSIAWKSKNDPNYMYIVDAGQLFFREGGPALPNPRDLQALLAQEQSAARLTLNRKSVKTSGVTEISNATINIQRAEFPSLQLPDSPVEEPLVQKKTPILEVKRWNEVVIGYDPKDGFWALIAEMAPGAAFSKTKATNFKLPAGQLRTLLIELASSETGNSISIADIIKKLGRLPPAAQVLRDARTIPGAIEAGINSELISKVKLGRKAISSVLKNLGSKFREIVSGPKGNSDPCFRISELDVHSGFVVRCLCGTPNGAYTFGPVPIDGC